MYSGSYNTAETKPHPHPPGGGGRRKRTGRGRRGINPPNQFGRSSRSGSQSGSSAGAIRNSRRGRRDTRRRREMVAKMRGGEGTRGEGEKWWQRLRVDD